MSLSIEVIDAATPALRNLARGLTDRRVRMIVGRAAVGEVKAHFRELDRSRSNSLGGKRTHFYAKAGRSTHQRNLADGVAVVISHTGIAQRYFGGTIRPVNAKRLAIPARAEAHGKRPREFSNLEVVYFRSGAMALQERSATSLRKTKKGFKKGKSVGGGIMFWLVKQVTHKADPSVLPTERRLADNAERVLVSYIEAVARGPKS